MKSRLASLMVFASLLVYAGPSYGCGADHGYTKTTAALSQSILTAERKDALMLVLIKSQSDHDKYTVSGDYTRMSDAVQELATINHELKK